MGEKLTVLPQPTATDLKAASREARLADGDYRFVVTQEPTFGTSSKNPQVYQAIFKLVPLKDPKDKKSVRPDLAITVFLAYPVSLVPNDPKQVVPTRDISDTCRFFRALHGDTFPQWPLFKQKGETAAQYEAKREACMKAAAKAFAEMHEKPEVVKNWVVEGRLKTKGEFQNKSFYEESYLKKLDPAWKYSDVVAA